MRINFKYINIRIWVTNRLYHPKLDLMEITQQPDPLFTADCAHIWSTLYKEMNKPLPNIDMIKDLIDTNEACINKLGDEGTLLDRVLRSYNAPMALKTQIVEFLLDKGADPNLSTSMFGAHALQNAVDRNIREPEGVALLVRMLVDKGADPCYVSAQGTALQIAVEVAARSRRWNEVDFHPVLIAVLESRGMTATCIHDAILTAVREDSVQSLLILLDHVSTEIDDKVMYLAVAAGLCDIVLTLLSHGMKLPSNILAYSTMTNGSSMVRILLHHDANIDGREDNSGKTTLINYVRYGDTDTVLVLLHRGADISLLDNSGKTALHYAAIEGDVNILSFFIDRGADVFAQTNEGFVPRDFAERGWDEAHNTGIRHAAFEQCATILDNEMKKSRENMRGKALAFQMGHHTRLGADSMFAALDPAVAEMIARMTITQEEPRYEELDWSDDEYENYHSSTLLRTRAPARGKLIRPKTLGGMESDE